VKPLESFEDVFAEVHAPCPHVRKQSFERGDLLGGLVPTVVDYDVYDRNRLAEGLPEPRIPLISDVDLDSIIFSLPAGRLDVDSVDPRLLAKIVLPELKAAPAEDTDLDYMDLTADELREMTMVKIKIVAPLPDPRSLLISIDIDLKRVRLARHGHSGHRRRSCFELASKPKAQEGAANVG
jgi:hypothetical protein